MCGAIGALGIILAFNFGGKPVYVMPLVFGGAPVITTLLVGSRRAVVPGRVDSGDRRRGDGAGACAARRDAVPIESAESSRCRRRCEHDSEHWRLGCRIRRRRRR